MPKLNLTRWPLFLGSMLFGMALGVLTLAFVLAGDIYEYQDTVDGVHLPEVDAIVCLAGGRGRIMAAGDIWYRYWELSQTPIRGVVKNPQPKSIPIFYVSGMGPQSNWQVFARQLRRGVNQVIRAEDVILERESQNTDTNAEWVARYAAERGWERVLIVTSSYHMKRARYIFERVLKARSPDRPVVVETLSVYSEPFEPGEWRTGFHGIRVTLIEYFKWIYYKSFWRK